MLIIVEGPDGAGKTTLISKLIGDLANVNVDHHGAYLGERRIAHHYFGSCYAALNGRRVIMDRSWRSEPVYGAAMRGGANRVSAWELRALETAASEAAAVTVFCMPPFETCERAWKSRLASEYPQKVDQLRAIYGGYAVAAATWPNPNEVVHYDYTAARTPDRITEIYNALRGI